MPSSTGRPPAPAENNDTLPPRRTVRRDLTAFLRRLGLSRTVRTLSRSVTAEGVDRLRELGRTSRRVLCLDLSERDEQCVQILRQGGSKPVVVGVDEFGRWMVRHGQMVLDQWDL